MSRYYQILNDQPVYPERIVREAGGPTEQHRPVVVIDPEDREAVGRLLSSLQGMSFAAHACGAFTCLQAALREYADPKPPKPDEPQGLGAVVEDAEGRQWIRVGRSELGPRAWAPLGNVGYTGAWKWYDKITAVRVLSEGVTA